MAVRSRMETGAVSGRYDVDADYSFSNRQRLENQEGWKICELDVVANDHLLVEYQVRF